MALVVEEEVVADVEEVRALGFEAEVLSRATSRTRSSSRGD